MSGSHPPHLLWVNDEFSVSVVIARCKQTHAGAGRWRIRFDTALLPDITVIVRMRPDNKRALDYYLLPRIDVFSERVRLAEDNGLVLDGYRFANLDTLYALATHVTVREAA